MASTTFPTLQPGQTYAILTLPPPVPSAESRYVTFTAFDANLLHFNEAQTTNASEAQIVIPLTRSQTFTGIPYTFTWQIKDSSQFIAWSGESLSGEIKGDAVPLTTLTSSTAANATATSVITTAVTTSPTLTGSNQPSTPTTALSPTHQTYNDSAALSSAEAAGVAIGCLIAGALISGLIFWFCLRKSNNKHGRVHDREAGAIALIHRGKGANVKAISLESDGGMVTTIDSSIPQPLEDNAISGEISKISNSIKNHVQSFYHSGRVSPGLIDYDDLQALGRELPISIGTLSTLLGNSTTREIALRFCIAWVVVSRMSPENAPNFLPPEVASCFQSMNATNDANKVQTLSLAKWRAITAEQLHTSYVKDAFSPNDARLQNLQDALRVLDQILIPYADSRLDNEQRRRNLEEILKRAAVFALTLFSQPSTWDFDWKKDDSVRTGSFCVFPSLVQVMNEKGDMVRPPQPFSEAVVRRLNE